MTVPSVGVPAPQLGQRQLDVLVAEHLDGQLRLGARQPARQREVRQPARVLRRRRTAARIRSTAATSASSTSTPGPRVSLRAPSSSSPDVRTGTGSSAASASTATRSRLGVDHRRRDQGEVRRVRHPAVVELGAQARVAQRLPVRAAPPPGRPRRAAAPASAAASPSRAPGFHPCQNLAILAP